jgi:D-alanine-D-alanine ligase
MFGQAHQPDGVSTMVKQNRHIEIVSSSQKWLSSMSDVSRRAIQTTLRKYYTKVGIALVDSVLELEMLVASQPDLVFLGMSFIPSNPVLGWRDTERIWLSEYLDRNNIAHTGSGQGAHILESNKDLAKQRVLDAGLRSSSFIVAPQHRQLNRADVSLEYPLFVKPTNRGGGQGIDSASVVHDFMQLKKKVTEIASKHKADSLIEKYLPGREFSVAILEDDLTGQLLSMPVELIAPTDEYGQRLLSRQVKSADAENVMGITNNQTKREISRLAERAFIALGARDYGRIDVRMDAGGNANFLEANLIPSLIADYGSFPKACSLNNQIDYESMILRIVRLGFARNVGASEDVRESFTPNTTSPAYF